MKKFLETLKGFVTLKTLAALFVLVSVVFFFLPSFTRTSAIGIKFVDESFSACRYMIGNPDPYEPSWEHLWIVLAFLLPAISVILLFGEQNTGKSIVIAVLLLGAVVTCIFMAININADYHTLIDEAIAKDLTSIAEQTITKETDSCYVLLGESNIFGTFGATATAEGILAKAGISASSKVASIAPLFIVNIVLLVAGAAISILGAIGVVDLNRSYAK